MLSRDFTPGGRAALHAKDARIVLDTAATLGLDLPVFAVVADELERLVELGRGDLDHSALVTLLEDRLADGDSIRPDS
jgi:2-hydroxy-3-oxopropionate reductase